MIGTKYLIFNHFDILINVRCVQFVVLLHIFCEYLLYSSSLGVSYREGQLLLWPLFRLIFVNLYYFRWRFYMEIVVVTRLERFGSLVSFLNFLLRNHFNQWYILKITQISERILNYYMVIYFLPRFGFICQVSHVNKSLNQSHLLTLHAILETGLDFLHQSL